MVTQALTYQHVEVVERVVDGVHVLVGFPDLPPGVSEVDPLWSGVHLKTEEEGGRVGHGERHATWEKDWFYSITELQLFCKLILVTQVIEFTGMLTRLRE